LPSPDKTTAGVLDSRSAALAEAVVDLQYRIQPQLAARYGEAGKAHCLKDAQYHLSYLAEAVEYGAEDLFCDYVVWAKSMLSGRGIPAEDLVENLKCMRDAARATLNTKAAATVSDYLEAAIRCVKEGAPEVASFVSLQAGPDDLARLYIEALLGGKRHAASRLVLNAADAGKSIADIYLNIFQPAQYEIGRLWQLNKITVAQEHYCTAATQLIMSQLYPRLFAGEKLKGNIVATCVGGDLHELGVRMVADFFELDGWNTFYLGANTPASSIMQTIADRHADIIAISATMTFHVRTTERLIDAIRANPASKDVKILIGGYPFNKVRDLWKRVGADGYAVDAQDAVRVANTLMES
jgi:methanogenic corrinoid protein MtbC1